MMANQPELQYLWTSLKDVVTTLAEEASNVTHAVQMTCMAILAATNTNFIIQALQMTGETVDVLFKTADKIVTPYASVIGIFSTMMTIYYYICAQYSNPQPRQQQALFAIGGGAGLFPLLNPPQGQVAALAPALRAPNEIKRPPQVRDSVCR